MAKVFVSPGVFTRELDVSFVPAAIQEIGAALVGPCAQGPAFTPIQINTFSDFRAIYGGTDKNLYLPYAAKAYLQNGNALTVTRILGTDNSSNQGKGFPIRFGGSALSGSVLGVVRARGTGVHGVFLTGSPSNFALQVVEGTTTSEAKNLSFDVASNNFIGARLGMDKTASGSSDELGSLYIDKLYTYAYSLVNGRGFTLNESMDATAGGSIGQGSVVGGTYNPGGGGDTIVNATSGVTGVSGYVSLSGAGDTAGAVASSYSNPKSPYVYSQNLNGQLAQLFRFHSLQSGESANTKVKIGITMAANQLTSSAFPKFTVIVRDFADTDQSPNILEAFSNCSLDPDSSSYIARVIGDRYPKWSGLGGAGSPELTFGGQYDNKSKYVRVEMSTDPMKQHYRPSAFAGVPKNALSTGDDAIGGLPNVTYKLDNFVSGTTPDPNRFVGANFDNSNLRDRLRATSTLATNGSDGTVNDAGFLLTVHNNSETGSTTAATSAFIGGMDMSTNAGNEQIDSAHGIMPTKVISARYDGTGTADGTVKHYQFLVPMYGGFDGMDQRNKMQTNIAGGALSGAYVDATSILSNVDEYDFNLLAFPGVTNASVGAVQSRAIDMCAGRGDAMFLAELGKDTAGTVSADWSLSVAEAVERAAGIDSSYAAAWYPWVRIYDADIDDFVWVPPSVEALGVMSFTDLVTHPWFAPAGFNRGGLENVLEAYRRLTQSQRDELYEGKINPIATFAGQGIYIFGQKTMQSKASALDRINVRRMLLHARKFIASLSKSVLFEQNSNTTRNRLRTLINNVLEPIRVKQGLTQFRVVIDDSNNGPDVIDRNQIVGDIFLQPTKTAEVIVLNFSIERTGATFEEV